MTSYLFKSFASGILFGASLVFALIHVGLTLFHVEVPAFWHHFLPLAYVLLLFLALRKPTHLKLLEINNEIKPLLYVIEWVLGIAVFSVYLSIRYLAPQYFIIISVFISAIVVSIGWWVQSIIAAARQRRQHTVNTIIQTRISDTYQKKLALFNSCFSDDEIYIDENVATYFGKHRSLRGFNVEAHNRIIKTSEDAGKMKVPHHQQLCDKKLRQIEESLYGAMYLLNYFEFISAGIKSRDLDNALLMDCFKDVVKNLERKCFFLLKNYRFNNARSAIFIEFENLCKNWLGGESLIARKRKGETVDSMLGSPFLSRLNLVHWND